MSTSGHPPSLRRRELVVGAAAFASAPAAWAHGAPIGLKPPLVGEADAQAQLEQARRVFAVLARLGEPFAPASLDAALEPVRAGYKVLALYARDAGRRSAALAFDIGPGTGELAQGRVVPSLAKRWPSARRLTSSSRWCREAVDVCWKQKVLRVRQAERAEEAALYERGWRFYERMLAEATA
jgi:hypothetical protein